MDPMGMVPLWEIFYEIGVSLLGHAGGNLF